MKPIIKYIKDLLAFNRVLGKDLDLKGLAKADTLLLDLVHGNEVPGLAITVLKEGEILLQKGYGYADLEKKVTVDPKSTILRIASVSKPIAATALAYMVAEDIIDLDASFYKYVPYYPEKEYDFTIRQLAGHTAGIRGYRGKEYALNKSYSIKESITIFKEDELLFEPGTDYHYNSYDWVLISLAMQEASGIPFEEYVERKVLQPLEMINTFPENLPEGNQGLGNTICYTKNLSGFREAVPVNNFYKLAGGGYLSTSHDIAKLGQAYLDGKILDASILSEFLTSQKINGESTYYGLGWQVSEDDQGRPYYGHVGNGVGGYSNFFVYPEQQMVFSILINCTDPKVQQELNQAIDHLIQENLLV